MFVPTAGGLIPINTANFVHPIRRYKQLNWLQVCCPRTEILLSKLCAIFGGGGGEEEEEGM